MQDAPATYRDESPSIVRDGGLLRVPALGAVLPARCAVCNGEPHGGRIRDVLHRASLPASQLVFWLVLCFASAWAFLWLKPTPVEYSLCRAHRKRRLMRRLLVVNGCLIAMILAFIALPVLGLHWLAWASLLSALAIGIWGRFGGAIIRLKARETELAWLEVSPAFLASFPEHGSFEPSTDLTPSGAGAGTGR